MRKKTTLFILAFMVASTICSIIPAVSSDEGTTIRPFIYATGSSPEGIDPLGAYDTSSGLIIQNVLEPLFAFDYSDPSMPTIPRLATTMGTWDATKTEWTVPLRNDVTFQNGQKFNATSVKWNFDRLNYLSLTGDCEHASLWFNDDGNLILNHTEIIDEYTVKFVLNKAWLDFEALLPFWGASLMAVDHYYDHAILEMNDIHYYFGTGPFMLDSIVVAEKTILTKYDDYYRGAADFDQVILAVYPSSTAADQALFNQEVHMIRSLYWTNLPVADSDPNVDYQKVKSACCYFFHLDVNSIPWAARKAMQWGFNYSYMVDVLYAGTTYEHHSPVPDGMWGYNGDIPGLPSYDLTTARAFLLADSTYGPVLATAGITASSPDSAWIALAEGATPLDSFNFTCYAGLTAYFNQLKDNFGYLGFKISNNVVGDWPAFLNYVQGNPNLDITMGGWCPDYFDAVNQIEPIFATGASSNWNHLSNSTLDTLMGQLHQTPQGAAKQTLIDQIVKGIIVDNAAAMYFQQSAEYVAWSSLWLDSSTVGDVFNARLDKIFYGMKWNPNLPNPDDDDDNGGIPGFTTGIMMAVAVGAAAYLVLRKRK